MRTFVSPLYDEVQTILKAMNNKMMTRDRLTARLGPPLSSLGGGAAELIVPFLVGEGDEVGLGVGPGEEGDSVMVIATFWPERQWEVVP